MPTPRKPATKSAVHVLYLGLAGDPEIDPGTQRRIYDYATRTGSGPLMAVLTANPNLDGTLDDLLAEHTDARVRAAWLARPGRSQQQIENALRTSRSSAVRAALAALPRLPEDAYQQLAYRADAKVAVALLGNKDAPLAAKKVAARAWAAHPGRGEWRRERELDAMFSEQLTLAGDLIAGTTDPSVTAWVLGKVELPEPVLHDIADRILLPATRTSATGIGSSVFYATQRTLEQFVQQRNMTDSYRLQVATAVHRWLETGFRQSGKTVHDFLRQHPVRTLPALYDPQQERIAAAVTPEQVAAARKHVLGSANQDHAVTFACNPHTGVDDVRAVAHLLTGPTKERAARARSGQLEVFAVIVVHGGGWDVLSDALLAATGRPADALVAVAAEWVTAGTKISPQLGKSRYLTADSAGALPLEFTARNGNTAARQAVAELLAAHLTSDERWATFEQLSGQFVGSLNSLLQACGFIHAEPQAAA